MSGATIWPARLPGEVTGSRYRDAEVRVWKALQAQLGAGWVVFYSRPWLGLTSSGGERDGECDFVVAHPAHGVLAIEVKGGGISYDPADDKWWSRDRDNIRHAIKNPVEQARSAKHELLRRMQAMGGWNSRRFVRFRHGVIFPDLGQIPVNLGMDKPREIFCCRPGLASIADWVGERLSGGDEEGVGGDGIKVLEKLLAAPFQLKVPLATLIDDDEQAIAALTPGQFRVLGMISALPRIAVGGGAGTGKTIVAFEDAARLAGSGNRTLLLCLGEPLADALSTRAPGTGVEVLSFAALCRKMVAAAELPAPDRLDDDVVSDAWIDALMRAAELRTDLRFDAIVVDEGQDFPSHWWVAIDGLLASEKSFLHAFYDTNQSIYGSVSSQLASFNLLNVGFEHNLRNTQKIHLIASGHYRGMNIFADGPEGTDITVLPCGEQEIAATAAGEARRLVLHENVSSGDIAILAPTTALAASIRQALDRSGTYVSVVDTVLRFKGLERPVVIVAASREIADEAELAYVAVSRARTHLVLVGQERILDWLRSPAMSGSDAAGPTPAD